MSETFARPEPSLVPIARPRCAMCQGRMTLTRIESCQNGPDLRTFACSKCEHAYDVLAEDPVKSAKVWWPNSKASHIGFEFRMFQRVNCDRVDGTPAKPHR